MASTIRARLGEVKVWTCACDYGVRTTPLICKLRHFRFPFSDQERGVGGARTRDLENRPPQPSSRPNEECSRPSGQRGRGLTSALGREEGGFSSYGGEASGWALTLSSSAGAPVSCRTQPQVSSPNKETSPRPEITETSPLLSRTAGVRVRPRSRRPPVQLLRCSCSRRPRMWRGSGGHRLQPNCERPSVS